MHTAHPRATVAATCAEPRETAATTTGLIVGYVRARGGDDAVAALLARAEVPFTAEELTDPARWFSYHTRIRLFEAATGVLGDPAAAFRIGASALENGLAPAIFLAIRAIGSPRRVFRQLPSAVSKFSTTSTMEMLDTGVGHATIRYRLHDGYAHSRLDCDYARGLISTVPCIFGLPPARVEHPACESDGHEACLYRVTWQRRPRLLHRVTGMRPGDPELRALRGQLQALQSAASDLVASDDIGATLARITDRAAAAVVAPAYLLAVRLPDGEPLVHSSGLDPAAAPRMAARLLDGEAPGPHAVVVDVATDRRHYGRLAAIYGAGQPGLADEAPLLSAYAAHAAAALEKVLALEASRRDEARARDLLTLAHQLAVAKHEQDVADVVARALPTIVGVPRAAVLSWDPGSGVLRVLASQGPAPAQRAALLQFLLHAEGTPEVARILTRREPLVVRRASASPSLLQVLEAVGSDVVLAAPLLADDTLLGLVTVSHGLHAPTGWPDAEAVERLRGVADQAASALHNAHLLARIRHQAHHDALTGLPNRAQFMQEVDRRLADASSPDGTPVAVLFCDLDGFKNVNDRYGHAAGDELLRQVAARLRAVVRGDDLVARLSGDEFAIVVSDDDVDPVSETLAERLSDQFCTSFRIEGREVRISTSVGVAVQQDDEDGDRLLRRADAAMYVAKQRGRNQVARADRHVARPAATRVRADRLRAGLAEGEFVLHYQPIVRLGAIPAGPTSDSPGPDGFATDGAAPDAVHPDTPHGEPRIAGYEALARWQHPQDGLLSPGAFLPLAEEAGCVADLDLWALRTAVTAAATWQSGTERLHVAVNLSTHSLADRRLPGHLRSWLSAADLDPALLTLEVTESRSLVDLPGVVELLVALRQLGVRVALDDFGTGYSTLAWLQRLPIDQIKIDRSFVAAATDDACSRALVDGVVALGRALAIEVVAEGVETPTQAAALAAAGCELAQGYLFGRPAPLTAGAPARRVLRSGGRPR